jgi:four helix bundle protein
MLLAKEGLTEGFPRKETFGPQSQIRRAAVSITSNIAEGHGRLADGHFCQFLATPRESFCEVQTQLELPGDLEYRTKRKSVN